jgi:hypothetical protein
VKTDRRQGAKRCLYGAMALVAIAAAACSSDSGSRAQDKSRAESGTSGGSGSHVDVMCIGDRINNPPESFHYSFKYADATGSEDAEANITPSAMDITLTDKSGSRSFHGVRSDETSWNNAVLDLSALKITAMSARLSSLDRTSAIISQGKEAMDGYPTSKYSIDTTSAKASDQRQFQTLFGNGSFEKGTVWMADDGCMAKLVLDEALAQTSGGVLKSHYEISRSKR